ncbi:hypothetical protein WQ54_09745 [Bacillus sp. SA1-12]|nr:hypothetical protein WQ54_09745 [Bacillus sp. SA1-12]
MMIQKKSPRALLRDLKTNLVAAPISISLANQEMKVKHFLFLICLKLLRIYIRLHHLIHGIKCDLSDLYEQLHYVVFVSCLDGGSQSSLFLKPLFAL